MLCWYLDNLTYRYALRMSAGYVTHATFSVTVQCCTALRRATGIRSQPVFDQTEATTCQPSAASNWLRVILIACVTAALCTCRSSLVCMGRRVAGNTLMKRLALMALTRAHRLLVLQISYSSSLSISRSQHSV